MVNNNIPPGLFNLPGIMSLINFSNTPSIRSHTKLRLYTTDYICIPVNFPELGQITINFQSTCIFEFCFQSLFQQQ
jgi:hypothetical protein